METLQFALETRENAQAATPAALAGVVGSGNLEVLMVPGAPPGRCDVTIKTSARGFGPIWEAVLRDFAARHPLGGTTITIHDMGATPAVVSLRLGQVLGDYTGGMQ